MFKSNKKAQTSFNVTMMIPRFVFLAIALLAIVLLVRSYVVTNIDVQETTAELFIQRTLMSPNALSYVDSETGRAYPGIVDPANFNESRLKKAIYYENSQILAANITLYEEEYEHGRQTESCYYNKEWYLNWYPRTIRSVSGSGSVSSRQYIKPVIIKKNSGSYKGFVEFNVIMPNG